jgi:hypothetical protein
LLLSDIDPSGIIRLPIAARFALQPTPSPSRRASPEARHQLCQLDQVADPAQGTRLPEHDLRVRRHKVRPLPRNGPDAIVAAPQQNSPAGATRPLAYANELLSAQRMERVRHPHKVRRRNRILCILE